MIAKIAAIPEKKIDFSSISAIVAILAITWKPLSSDHNDRSDSKSTRINCIRSRFSRLLPTQTLRKQSTWHFLRRKYKNTTVFTTNFQRNIEKSRRTSTRWKAIGEKFDLSAEHEFSVLPVASSSTSKNTRNYKKTRVK